MNPTHNARIDNELYYQRFDVSDLTPGPSWRKAPTLGLTTRTGSFRQITFKAGVHNVELHRGMNKCDSGGYN